MVETTKTGLITIFLGVYNGEIYLPSLKEQLESQTFQNFNLLVVDNASKDKSYERLLEWMPDFGARLTLLKNDENLGGGGSLFKTLSDNHITTDWFITMHQDDFYLPNHLEVLFETIAKSPPNVVAVCSGMGSMDEHGKRIPTKPRAAWLVREETSASSFLINLRFQSLSWPSSAFKAKEFSECFRYWHSPACSDTETTLYLCGHGEFRYLKTETMRYRENPQSESHVVNRLEASIATSISLTRVFTSDEYRSVLKAVELKERDKFYIELISAIEIRIPESPLSHFTKIIATEECCRIWGFHVSLATNVLAETYLALGSDFTSNLLNRFTHKESKSPSSELMKTLAEISQIRSIAISSPLANPKSRLRTIYNHLPLRFRMRLFRFYVRLYAIKQPNHYWNSNWK